MEDTFRDKSSEYGSLTCLGGDYDQFAMFFKFVSPILYSSIFQFALLNIFSIQ